MTTWHNLPCAPTLSAVSQLCPHGWVELYVEHFNGDSGPGGSTPQEPDSSACIDCFWGVTPEDADRSERLLDELADDVEAYYALLRSVSHGGTALLRVVHPPLTCWKCGQQPEAGAQSSRFCERPECDGELQAISRLESFGVDGKPVWTPDDSPSLTGQQPAPRPGTGDMWAEIIERAEGHIRPEVVALFKARRDLGIDRYGTPLQAGNGRDVCDEMIHESLDRIAYAEQAAHERPELTDIMREMQLRDIATIGGLLAVYGRIDAEEAP